MLDLNDAEEQKEGSGGPIPPRSIVLVQMTIRQAEDDKAGAHPLITRSATGYEYLNAEFKVISGQFEGRAIWENLGLAGMNDGQRKGVDIAKRKLRAMVEAARNINPKDQSPPAVGARRIQDLAELNGLRFGIKVGVEKPKVGDKYVNNNISLVITPDHEAYTHVMAGGEIITEEPIPAIPEGGAPAKTAAAPWAKGGAAPAAPATPPASSSKPAPAWAKQSTGTTPPPSGGFPPQSSPPPGHPAHVS